MICSCTEAYALPHVHSAVDVQGLARQVRALASGEINHGVSDVLDRAKAPQRNLRLAGLARWLGQPPPHLSLQGTWRGPIDVDSEGGVHAVQGSLRNGQPG